MTRRIAKIVSVSFFFLQQTAIAQSNGSAPAKSGDEYQYPELLVAPSASERLKEESKNEDRNAWTINIPVQLSAASTLLAGLVALSDPGKSSGKDEKVTDEARDQIKWASSTGVAIGGAWLGATALLSAKYRPYKTGDKELAKVSGGDKKAQLARERLAEEALEAPAILQGRLKWIALASNLGAAGFIASSAGDASTKITAGIAGIMAFTPILFSNHWEDTWRYQESYKKKVYGPLTGLGFTPDRRTGALTPMVNLAWNF